MADSQTTDDVPPTRFLRAQYRDLTAQWLFERDYRERSLASPDDAPWGEWVERNQEEWRVEADDLAYHLVAMGWTPPQVTS